MALFVIATPIGNPGDITLRAMESLKRAELVIGEELKELRQILKAAGVQAPATDQLNEHSDAQDIEHFVDQAREKNVALVSDCGTPGFCDPGADLVKACRKAGIAVHAVPGASSLMTFLSVCGERLDTFAFNGFVPAKREARENFWRAVAKETRPVILMETPYRCGKLIEDLAVFLGEREIVVGLNLTQDSEQVVRARGRELSRLIPGGDAEPIALVLPLKR
ncbi:MAG TPA: SAM-dependent methyltransferase [Bdellovibrionales bacterium]|nr:SAM-dependent methyltransferase [Bdellovibrionales bacterium]